MPQITVSDRTYKKLQEIAKYLELSVEETIEWMVSSIYDQWYKEITS